MEKMAEEIADDDGSEGTFWQNVDSELALSISDLLDKEDVNLIDILFHESCLNEARSKEPSLLAYFTQPKVTLDLIKLCFCTDVSDYKSFAFLKVEAAEDEIEDSFVNNECEMVIASFVASEILCIDSQLIVDTMVNSANLVAEVFSVLESPRSVPDQVFDRFFTVLENWLSLSPLKTIFWSILPSIPKCGEDEESGFVSINAKPSRVFCSMLNHMYSSAVGECYELIVEEILRCQSRIDYDSKWIMDSEWQFKVSDFAKLQSFGRNELNDCLDMDEAGTRLFSIALLKWGSGVNGEMLLECFEKATDAKTKENCAMVLAFLLGRSYLAVTRFAPDGAKVAKEINLRVEEESKGLSWYSKVCQRLCDIASFQAVNPVHDFCCLPESSTVNFSTGSKIAELVRLSQVSESAVLALSVLIDFVKYTSPKRWTTPQLFDAQDKGHEDNSMPTHSILSAELHNALPPGYTDILKNMKHLMICLSDSRQVCISGSSEEKVAQRFGMHRLMIVKLVCVLLQSKYPDLIRFFTECDAVPGKDGDIVHPLVWCLDAFFKFEDNNCLHSSVTEAIEFIFTGLSYGVTSDDVYKTTYDMHINDIIAKQALAIPSITEVEEHKSRDLKREEDYSACALKELRSQILFSPCHLISRLGLALGQLTDANCQVLSEDTSFSKEDVEGKYVSRNRAPNIGFCHRMAEKVLQYIDKLRDEVPKEMPFVLDDSSECSLEILRKEMSRVNILKRRFTNCSLENKMNIEEHKKLLGLTSSFPKEAVETYDEADEFNGKGGLSPDPISCIENVSRNTVDIEGFDIDRIGIDPTFQTVHSKREKAMEVNTDEDDAFDMLAAGSVVDEIADLDDLDSAEICRLTPKNAVNTLEISFGKSSQAVDSSDADLNSEDFDPFG